MAPEHVLIITNTTDGSVPWTSMYLDLKAYTLVHNMLNNNENY